MNIKKYEIADSGILDHILDNITSAVFLINKKAEIQAYNKPFARLFQLSQEDLTGVLFGNIINCHVSTQEKMCGTLPECRICDIRNSITTTIDKNLDFENITLAQEVWSEGVLTNRYFKISTKAINYNGIRLALVILDDITELEKQKTQLEAQNRKLQEMNELKNRFLGIAAHDLRNPLAAIQGCSMIMSRTLDVSSKEEMMQLLDIISEKSQFSLNLINDLLDITKIESGHMELVLEENDYVELLVANARIYKLLADSKNLDLELEVKGELPPFKFDKNRIEQALNNLIDNAIKYSVKGTKIHIETYVENGFVVTNVKDQGFGIPENELVNIFQPFHRANVDPNNKHKSTGLGLAIVQKIIEGHNGEMKVESQVGIGSVFTYLLPMSRIN